VKIHIVERYHSNAMARMTAPLFETLPEYFDAVTVGENIDPDADLNYHIPWHFINGDLPDSSTKHVILYTHLNPPARADLIKACKRADHIVAMSKTGKAELTALGVDAEKITVIYAGHTDYKPRARNIGIVGYEQPNGRKRGHILLDLCWLMDVSRFNFIFSGGGWGDTVAKMASAGANVMNLGELDSDEKMQTLYTQLDLLLVTSYIEGGPLTILEALSAGVPVIAPPVGYAADLLPDDCIYHNVEGLIAALENFTAPIQTRRESVLKYTNEEYAKRHAELFERLLWLNTSTQTDTVTISP
jgi:glycosyltransferase involved in cell wall biosynthesis